MKVDQIFLSKHMILIYWRHMEAVESTNEIFFFYDWCWSSHFCTYRGFLPGKDDHELRRSVKKIDFKELLEHFLHIQHKHAVARKTQASNRERLLREGNIRH